MEVIMDNIFINLCFMVLLLNITNIAIALFAVIFNLIFRNFYFGIIFCPDLVYPFLFIVFSIFIFYNIFHSNKNDFYFAFMVFNYLIALFMACIYMLAIIFTFLVMIMVILYFFQRNSNNK